MRRTYYPPAEVAAWQPRARHFYHARGYWHAPTFFTWIEEGLALWCQENGLDRERDGLRRKGAHEAFTAWLEANCLKCGGVV